MRDNMVSRWQWSAIVVSILAAPAFGQGQTLVLWDTKGWSLEILRPKLQEPGVLIRSGAPDAEFRARSERMFREWVADWPREQLARQLTDSDLKAAKASLMTAESSLTTARADYWKIWTGILDDFRRHLSGDALLLLNELSRPGIDVRKRMLPAPFIAAPRGS